MINLLEIEKNFLIPHIKKGGVAVDFTMGNGHDTLWLSEAMGENGKVYAFDIQPQALESSRKLLEASGAAPNYTLILDSHSNVMDYVKEKICIGMFNLGFLPGGDKSITTKRDTTMIAIRAQAGSASPADIVLPVLISTLAAGLTGIALCKFFSSRSKKHA